MSQQSCDRIFVRDGQRALCWQACDPWDRTTMLACLASDPRSFEELAIAWSRYRPDQPLMDLEWLETDEVPNAGEWLALDLAGQRYAGFDRDGLPGEPGCYQSDDGGNDGRNRLAWINVPPWWQQLPVDEWALAAHAPVTQAATNSDISPTSLPAMHAGDEPAHMGSAQVDFRAVLYGRPLMKYVAEQVLGYPSGHASKGKRHSPAEAAKGLDAWASTDRPAQALDGLSAQEQAQVLRWNQLTKRIHARWLMTARAELGGRTPRSFLHEYREWKDRELDHRRSQWSRERRPPPPAPPTSALFQYGPMGTEEVSSYFDLCRHIITTALQLVDDEPNLRVPQLIKRLEMARAGWLSSEPVDGGGPTVQEVIDGERQLMPRLADSDPIDCDCPLCRIHTLEPELFGPAFSMCDTFREDMEEDFVFSLYENHEDWQNGRDEWLSWSGSISDSPAVDEDENAQDDEADAGNENDMDANQGSNDAGTPKSSNASQLEDSSDDWSHIWQSSFSDMSHGNPRLSLLGIGGHLSEIIEDLKQIGAAREEIEQLNRAFDELARSIRKWLMLEATVAHGEEAARSEPAAGDMIDALEAASRKYPQLTAKSADLQSRIHQWQRQLSPSRGS